jgi:hypothetical protein
LATKGNPLVQHCVLYKRSWTRTLHMTGGVKCMHTQSKTWPQFMSVVLTWIAAIYRRPSSVVMRWYGGLADAGCMGPWAARVFILIGSESSASRADISTILTYATSHRPCSQCRRHHTLFSPIAFTSHPQSLECATSGEVLWGHSGDITILQPRPRSRFQSVPREHRAWVT